MTVRSLEQVEAAERKVQALSWPARALRLARRKPVGALSAFLIVLIVFIAVFANVLAPHDPYQIFKGYQNAPFGTVADGSTLILGGDEAGRDLLSRLIFGARVSLIVSIGAVGISKVFAIVIGLTSGYFGKTYDLLVQRVIDSMQAIPTLLLAMLIMSVLGQSLFNVILAIAIGQISGSSRVVRGLTLSAKENVYVEAARVIGATNARIMFRHILPNITAPIIVIATLSLGGAILVEATLSFLGLGSPPPTPSWGSMINFAKQYFIINPWLLILPATTVSFTVLAFNLGGDALRDIWDPRLRGR